MSFSRTSLATAVAALLLSPLAAAQEIFFDDFEAGLGNWTASPWFQLEDASTGCFASITPFPSGTKAAYYGDPSMCTFWFSVPARLELNTAIPLPASAGAAHLVFDSYEEAECAICQYDSRYVEVSVDGGPWLIVEEGDRIFEWYQRVVDLTPYLGSSVRIRFWFVPLDPFENDFLGWVIDDVRITLTDPPASFCSGKTNSLGCVPFLTSSGLASATSTGSFQLVANDVLPDEAGFLLYSFKKSNLDFHGGKLCVKAPVTRLLPPKVASQQGTPPCTGFLKRNFNPVVQSGNDPLLTTGQTVHTQWLQRDPADPAGFGDSLTNGMTFAIAP